MLYGSLFFENWTLFFWKSEFVFLKIGVCFFENRNLFLSKIRGFFFGKSEFVFENGGLIFGNRSLSSSKIGVCSGKKSEFVFWKSEYWPQILFCLLLLSRNKISGGSRGGARGIRPPPLAFKKSEYVFKLLHKFCPWTQLSNFDQSQHKNWTKSVTNAWSWRAKSKATVFPACNSWLNFRVRGQFEIKILIVRHINTTYFIWILKKLNLSLRSFENQYLVSG